MKNSLLHWTYKFSYKIYIFLFNSKNYYWKSKIQVFNYNMWNKMKRKNAQMFKDLQILSGNESLIQKSLTVREIRKKRWDEKVFA